MIRKIKIESLWSFLAWFIQKFLENPWKFILLFAIAGLFFAGFKIDFHDQSHELKMEKTPIRLKKPQ